ncbi:MAG: bifunctional DNA-formamidopyrimidine glycosylase/DNA-(apurinic or apyrimidinic site) lyase [Acidimicrobiales bacterium]
MPELPEVETIRRDLEKEVVGRRIKQVEVKGKRSVRRHKTTTEFRKALEGKKVASVRRAGKYLLVGLDADEVLVVHLGMSGQLLRAKGPKDPLERHTHVIITFTQGGQLRFVDPRTFGEMFLTSSSELDAQVPELAHLGFDPLDEVMSWTRFGQLLISRHVGLKTLLMDQKFVAGIGNIYSDEILFAAGLRYDRYSDSLSSQEIRRLYRAMIETLSEAVKYRGSSLADEQYRDLFGEIGDFQAQHQVYDREGKPCRRCRNSVVRVKLNGRSAFLCDHCQI